MKKTIALSVVLCSIFTATAQSPKASIATWKNNAKGVYSFIHDDYGDNAVIGIKNYADSIARNRGIKFTFGAITSSCEANPGMWTYAIDMINYGHEIINHSHTHTCAVLREGWCETGLWAEPATENFAQELTHSTDLIKTKTGTYPRYFIYPYDQYNDTANAFLKSIKYIGSRTGMYDGTNDANFQPDKDGFFKTAFTVSTDGTPISVTNLNSWVDYAIGNGVWVNRELHNVGNTGWGCVTVDNYRKHINYLQSKVQSNELWVGTISEVLTYQIQKLNFIPATKYDAAKKTITISWNTPSFNVDAYLLPLSKKSPVTMLVDLDGIGGYLKVFQGNKEIKGMVSNGIMQFDAYPSTGDIVITEQTCPGLCLLSALSNQTVNVNENASFSISLASINTIAYKWYFNNVLIPNENGAVLSLIGAKSNQAGTYKVVASAGAESIESTATLTVLERKPFTGTWAKIPGTIQFEEFDIAGSIATFYDSSPMNEGDASMRSESVDIENASGGGYNIGYTTDGEWMKYGVNINNSGSYTVKIRTASISPVGKIKLYLDGIAISDTLSFKSSGGWQTWIDSSFSGIILASGWHDLKVEIISGEINLDQMTFILDNASSSADALSSLRVKAYPNPFQNNFTISCNLDGVSNVKIFNIEGQIIESHSFVGNNNGLRLGENLVSGLYFVEVISKHGNERVKVLKR